MIEAFTHAGSGQDARTPGRLLHPHRLTFARQLRGMTQTALAERVGCSRAEIARLERGVDRPDALALGRLSLALGLPLAFFRTLPRRTLLLTEPGAGGSGTTGQADRLRILREAELVLALLDGVGRLVRLPAERVSGYGWPAGVRPASVAETVRQAGLQLGNTPLADMVETLEASCGVFVILQQVDATHAFAGWWGPRPFAILPAAASRVERRLLAARCLGELLLEENNEALGMQDVERFARCLLAPPAAFAVQFTPRPDRGRLLALAELWGMPTAAVLEHGRDLLGLAATSSQRRARPAAVTWEAEELPTWLSQVLDVVGGRISVPQLAGQLALHPSHVEELLVGQAAQRPAAAPDSDPDHDLGPSAASGCKILPLKPKR